MEFLGQTGLDALQGADILKVAPERYSSDVEYADTTLAKKLKGIAQVHMADLGTRVFYCDHGSFDSHAGQPNMLSALWDDLSTAVNDFFDDLRAHDASDNVIMLLFSEFGRRTHDNGSGTDHGAAGAVLVIGDNVNGGAVQRLPVPARRRPRARRCCAFPRLPQRLFLHRGRLDEDGRKAHRGRRLREGWLHRELTASLSVPAVSDKIGGGSAGVRQCCRTRCLYIPKQMQREAKLC